MTLLLHSLVHQYLPSDRRQNAKGWWQFNAVCCHHRGHNRETKNRGNFLASPDGSMVYNCYNCNFKTGFYGNDITKSFETWMSWLNIPSNKIQEAKLEILSKKLSGEIETIEHTHAFNTVDYPAVELPDNANLLENFIDKPLPNFTKCLEYLQSRGRAIYEGWDYYWSPSYKHDMQKRIIIPFKFKNKIIGWTGRYFGKPPSGVPRYFNSDLPQGYIFNCDSMLVKSRKYVLITEGPLDAISIDCVSPLGSTMNKQQIELLNGIDKEKIVVPDREQHNQELIDVALSQGWSVSFPSWEQNIKDAADASKYYGKLYTLHSIISAKTNSQLEIGVKRQLLKG